MKIFHHPFSPNCRKVVATAKHLGLSPELVHVELSKGEHMKPEYQAVNPNSKVPSLVDGDFTLWESNAICAYLASTKESTLWPTDRRRFQVMQWAHWEGAHLAPCLSTFNWENVFKKFVGGGEPDAAALEKAKANWKRFGGVLEAHLAKNKWLVGDGMTLADFIVASAFSMAGPAGIPLGDTPNIVRWLAAIDEVPAWRATAMKM
jgi:glutathione S-transferase